MAETAAAPKGKLDLGKKIGPLPLGVWLLVGGGLLWYFHKQQSSSAAAGTTAASTNAQPGYGTDPAGNTGQIDPSTGYVYGSPEDAAALGQGAGGSAGSGGSYGGSAGSGYSGGGGTYDTSGQTTGSTNASGTSVTTPGAPAGPTIPTPGAVTTGGKGWQYPAPSGLAASSVTDSGFRVSWNGVQGPQGQKPGTYTVQTWQGNSKVDQFSSGSTNTAEYGAGGKGLKPSTTYRVDVWANGGPVAPPHSSITVTTKTRGSK